MDEPIYDLQRLAKFLEAENRYPELTKAIRLAYTVASASTDLLRVKRNLELIIRLQTSGGMPPSLAADDGGNVIEALFVASVIVYSRATVTTPIARRSWWGPDKLPKDLRRTHDTVILLRDKEIAHFGKGSDVVGEPLLLEFLYFSPGDRSPINFRANNWSTRPELIYEMVALVAHVRRDAEKRMRVQFESVAKNLAEVRALDSKIVSLVRNFVINDPRFHREPPGEAVTEGANITRVWTTVQSRILDT